MNEYNERKAVLCTSEVHSIFPAPTNHKRAEHWKWLHLLRYILHSETRRNTSELCVTKVTVHYRSITNRQARSVIYEVHSRVGPGYPCWDVRDDGLKSSTHRPQHAHARRINVSSDFRIRLWSCFKFEEVRCRCQIIESNRMAVCFVLDMPSNECNYPAISQLGSDPFLCRTCHVQHHLPTLNNRRN
jgi:hypothetical protein